MPKSPHDRAVDRLSRIFGGSHRRKGTDLLSNGRTIEVAMTESDLYQSLGQLKGSRAQRKFIAVPYRLVEKAKKVTKSTGIGVMNTRGSIKKKSRRK